MRKIKIGEKEYTLHYGQNSICALEDELDESIIQICLRLDKGEVRFNDVRAVLWAGLLYDDRHLTPEDVGDICDKAGVTMASLFAECAEELQESFSRYLPATEEKNEDVEKNE